MIKGKGSIRRGNGIAWEDLTLTQKRHRIYSVTAISTLRFWVICGKDRQKYYQDVPMSEDNIDGIRSDLFQEYMHCLETTDKVVLDRDKKINLITKVLYGKGE